LDALFVASFAGKDLSAAVGRSLADSSADCPLSARRSPAGFASTGWDCWGAAGAAASWVLSFCGPVSVFWFSGSLRGLRPRPERDRPRPPLFSDVPVAWDVSGGVAFVDAF